MAAGLLAAPGVASAAAPSPIEATYASLGGPSGVLGAALGAEDCTRTGGGRVQDYVNGEIVWSAGTGAHALTQEDVLVAWLEVGAEDGDLGYPATDTFCGLRDGGCGQHLTGGSVYWSAATGAVAVPEELRRTWAATGWEYGPLGYPTAQPECGLEYGTCLQRFQRGSVYAVPGLRPSATYGPVLDVWAAQGWEHGSLGLPTSSVFCGLRGGGCGEHFEDGSVYWSPATGGHVVRGDVYDSWAAQGWEQGVLGLPVSDPFTTVQGGAGRHFRGGSVYEARGETHVVPGAIRDRWAALGWERGQLGPPTGAAFCGLRDGGCGQHFQGGAIYSSAAGVFAVPDGLRVGWAATGWEGGPLGFPTSALFCGLRDGGCGQFFQGGAVYSSGPVGVRDIRVRTYPGCAVSSPFFAAWAAQGWENGRLGYPTSNAYQAPGGLTQSFQHGSLQLVNGQVR